MLPPTSIEVVTKIGLQGSPANAMNGGAANPAAQVTPEQRQKFSELMDRSHTPDAAEQSNGINAVTNVLQSQQDSIDQASNHMIDLVQNMGHMAPMEQFTAFAAAQNQIAATTVRMQLATGAVKGSKQSLQHLLKNE